MTVLSPQKKNAFDRGIRPLMELVLPDHARDVLDFRPDPTLQGRIDELAAKANEGELSEDERAEYEGYIRANSFVAVLQRQARKIIDGSSQQ